MASSTVVGKTLVASGKQTVKTVTVGTAATSGRFSIHDCAAPNMATMQNMVWPFCGGGGSPTGPLVNGTTLPMSVTVVNGIVLHVPDAAEAGQGSFTVTY